MRPLLATLCRLWCRGRGHQTSPISAREISSTNRQLEDDSTIPDSYGASVCRSGPVSMLAVAKNTPSSGWRCVQNGLRNSGPAHCRVAATPIPTSKPKAKSYLKVLYRCFATRCG